VLNVTITIYGHFDAAHRMPTHAMTTRRRLHGHTYKVWVTLENASGQVDVEQERARLSSVLLGYDHRQLAQSQEDVVFADESPVVLGEPVSMEAIARHIASEYQKGAMRGLLRCVRVSSQPDAYAEVTL